MPTVYFDDKDKETTLGKAAYALVRRMGGTKQELCMCPSCKQKVPVSDFVEPGVCKTCDAKRKQKSKSFKHRYEGKGGMTKATRR